MEPKSNKNKKIILIIALVFSIPVLIYIGIIIYEWGMDAKQLGNLTVFASVNDDEIRYMDYASFMQHQMESYKENNKKELAGKELEEMRDEIFNILVMQKILEQNINKNNIKVENKEIEYIMNENPALLPDEIKSIFSDSNGVFQETDYKSTMNSKSSDVEKFKESLILEVKSQFETKKLFDIITKNIKLGDEELKSGKTNTDLDKLLKDKKDLEYQKWFKEMKQNAIIVDNRKKFEK